MQLNMKQEVGHDQVAQGARGKKAKAELSDSIVTKKRFMLE